MVACERGEHKGQRGGGREIYLGGGGAGGEMGRGSVCEMLVEEGAQRSDGFSEAEGDEAKVGGGGECEEREAAELRGGTHCTEGLAELRGGLQCTEGGGLVSDDGQEGDMPGLFVDAASSDLCEGRGGVVGGAVLRLCKDLTRLANVIAAPGDPIAAALRAFESSPAAAVCQSVLAATVVARKALASLAVVAAGEARARLGAVKAMVANKASVVEENL